LGDDEEEQQPEGEEQPQEEPPPAPQQTNGNGLDYEIEDEKKEKKEPKVKLSNKKEKVTINPKMESKEMKRKSLINELRQKHLQEKAPPGREDQVKALKSKVGKDSAYAIAWAQHNKHGKPSKEEEVVSKEVRKVDFVDGITEELTNKDGHTFVITHRDIKGKGQDKVRMHVQDKSGKKIKDWGSHVSLDQARKFAKSRGFNEMSGDMAYRAMDKAEKKSRGELSVTDPAKAKRKARQAQKFADYSIKKTLNKEEVEIDESDKAMMMKLTTKAMKAIPNSPQQKELIKQVNVYREKLGMKPMREDYSELEESALLQMKMAADDIETYAKKHGGIDKKDMMKTATMLKKGNKKGALKFIKTLDTDPRDYLLKTMGEEENRGPRTDAEKKAHLDKIFKHIDNVRKKKEAKLGFKITDVTPKGYGPTDEAKGDSCWDGYKKVGMKKKGGRMVPNCVPEETNLERLKKTLAIHKFKKGGGEIEKQPEGDAYNAMKWRGKTHSTRDEDQENERARNVMAYRKVLRARKKAKKKK